MERINQPPQTANKPETDYNGFARIVCAFVAAAVAGTIAPSDAQAKNITGLVNIDERNNPQPYQPQTYFVTSTGTKIETKPHQPALFEITQATPLTFYVTGPATVRLQFHSIAHKHEEMPYKADITVDGEKFAIPHPSPSKIDTGPITIGAGTHAITVTPIDPHSFRVALVGAQETAMPSNLPAPYVPFEADPDLKLVIEKPCVFKLAPGQPQGYEDVEVIHHPTIDEYQELKVAGMPAETERIPNSPLVTSSADNDINPGETGALRYELPAPIYPIDERLCTYVLTVPRVHATADYSGPYSMPLYASVSGNKTAGYTATVFEKPKDLTCQTHNIQDKTSTKITRALLYCWDEKGDAHGTTLYTGVDKSGQWLHYTLERQ